MKNLMAIPVPCLLIFIACANTSQHPTQSSASHTYDGLWEGYAQTPEGLYSIKMEIKNGTMSGFIEDTKISGYIDADNKLITTLL